MLIIGIAGGSGSGKTTIAQAIQHRLGPDTVQIISQDSYYHDHTELSMEQRAKINYDHPDSFENELLIHHLNQLKKGQAVHIPVYDFSTHTRSHETVYVAPKSVIILEGILILADPELRDVMDAKIFVDTDPDVRILRRAIRDTTERGRTLESIDRQYLSTVKPMHEAFVEPSKKYANVIVPEGGKNEVAISLLTSWVERYLVQSLTSTTR
ncbi:uridine kinase [Ammoniphilus sp. CFH 90114]|uniref:uridine kinase n=1 Tax=Ammoniphilus sp. CFH 90114 TaxID=2493665 RepID=UPI00100FE0F5|nr:uridine kinase [Ammoniphilus sp. CFH 90114]RXT04822.1 uridine kinase [Ammoniphilus sp. CFH 90114]